MQAITIKNTVITILFFLVIRQSVIITNPLPLQFSSTHQGFVHDHAWTEDAMHANATINHFVEPADTVNYADYRYVGTHNAHVYPRFFKIIRQQDQTILEQLSYGVRGLMLDTYDWNYGWPFVFIGPTMSHVCLSHLAPGLMSLIQKGTFTYQSLNYELRRVVEFMKVNLNAVITIILEDYADPVATVREIKEVMSDARYDVLFKPADMVGDQWPTLGWMREHNKRLVIFTQKSYSSDVTFHEFSYMVENHYGTTNKNALCQLRAESNSIGSLITFNNFTAISFIQPMFIIRRCVHYDTVQSITTDCQAQHFAHGRLFNGYWADRVIDACDSLYHNKQKTIFEYVNELNAHPNKTMT